MGKNLNKPLGHRVSAEHHKRLAALAKSRGTSATQALEDAIDALAGQNKLSTETLIQAVTARLNAHAETERQLDAALDQIERLTAKD